MSTSTEVSETTSSCSPIHTSTTSSSATNNGAIQKRIRTCPPNNESISSPSKNGLTLNIKPSWMSSTKIQLLQVYMYTYYSTRAPKEKKNIFFTHAKKFREIAQKISEKNMISPQSQSYFYEFFCTISRFFLALRSDPLSNA